MELIITEQDAYTRLFRQAIDKWGLDAQQNQLIEEFAEVIQAINKWRRDPNERTMDHLHEEIADAQICIDQMLETFLSAEQVKDWYRKKMARMESRL